MMKNEVLPPKGRYDIYRCSRLGTLFKPYLVRVLDDSYPVKTEPKFVQLYSKGVLIYTIGAPDLVLCYNGHYIHSL